MDVSRETLDVTTKPKCYDSTNMLAGLEVVLVKVRVVVDDLGGATHAHKI